MSSPPPQSLTEDTLIKLRRLKQLQAQQAAREADAAVRYRTDPTAWVDDRLGEFAWSKQRQIVESVRDHRRTAVKSCHGVGKSHIASRVIAWWLDSHPVGEAFVVTTAPTTAQVEAILWRYIGQAHRRAALPGRTTLDAKWYISDELVAFGRKPANYDEAAFQGIHARYVLVVIDEASGVPEQLWVAADALTTNDGCRILAIGNPADPMSHFAKVCDPASGWNTIGISAYESPNLTGETVPDSLRDLLISKNWVAEKAQEWGTDSPLFSEKVLGEFPKDASDQIVRSSDLARCRQARDVQYTPDQLLPVVLGVDVASGGDETVVRERRGITAGREWKNRSDDTMTVVDLVLTALDATGATLVNVDGTGVGEGVSDRLEQLRREGRHSAQVVKVKVGSASTDPKTYANLKSQIWWEIGRLLSEQQGWDLSAAQYFGGRDGMWKSGMQDSDAACAQLLAVKWKIDASGRIQVEKKEDLIARMGRSPDNADALLLAFYVPQGGTRRYLEALVAEQETAEDRPVSLPGVNTSDYFRQLVG